MRRACSAVLILAALLIASRATAADPEDAFVLIVDAGSDPAWPVEELALRLRVELGKPVAVAAAATPRDDRTRVELANAARSGSPTALTRVEIRIPSAHASRIVELGDLPAEDRPRALALAIAEIVRHPAATSKAESPSPSPSSSSPGPLPPAPASTRSSLELGVTAAGGIRYYPQVTTLLPGVRLGATFAFPASRRFVVDVDGGYATASFHDALGDVRVDVWSASAAGFVDLLTGRVRLGIGPRAEVAFPQVQATASPGADGRSFGSTFFTATLAAKVSWQLTPHLAPFVSPEIGATFDGIELRADQRTTGGLGGAVGIVHAGIAAAL